MANKSNDRREEFRQKATELQSKKQELEARGKELKNNSDMPPEEDNAAQAPVDRRDEFKQKAQELLSMQGQLQEKGDDIARRNGAGLDGSSGGNVVAEKDIIDSERVKQFTKILEEYKEGKKNLDNRIKNNQEWWKLRHYGNMSPKEGTAAVKDLSQKNDARPKSVTAWTVNSVVNKHADYMDNYPEAVCLPVEESDKEFAQKLSSVLPALRERVNYEQTYSDLMWYKIIAGTCVEYHGWDQNALNGLGDIVIKKCDILKLFWEPGVTDIQDSEYFFNVDIVSNSKIRNMFPDIPELKTRLSNPTVDIVRYNYDDTVKTTDHSLVVDVYYHKVNSKGKTVLHYCKYVNDIVLFASENNPLFEETGYYKHGKYPYIFDTMFPVEGSPCGFGYIDIAKEVQKDIDELNDDFMHNAKEASHRRYAVNDTSGVNETELTDVTNEVVHCSGAGLDDGNFKELETKPLDSIYFTLYESRINELKEVSNNRDVASGGTTSGVTAASAIAAMQEAGSKTSRDQESASYRANKLGYDLDIELIAQFYTETRYFRITGENGQFEFVGINNKQLEEQTTTDEYGNELSRKPNFDIKVKPQKRSQYSTMADNELKLQFYQLGIFNPQNATQATLLINNMEFEGKEMLLSQISQNGTIYQMLMQYQQIAMAMAQQLDTLTGSNYTMQVQTAIQAGQVPFIQGGGNISLDAPQMAANATNGNNIVDGAREQTRQRSEVK